MLGAATVITVIDELSQYYSCTSDKIFCLISYDARFKDIEDYVVVAPHAALGAPYLKLAEDSIVHVLVDSSDDGGRTAAIDRYEDRDVYAAIKGGRVDDDAEQHHVDGQHGYVVANAVTRIGWFLSG